MHRLILLAFLTVPTWVSATLVSTTLISTSFWMVAAPAQAESTSTSIIGPDVAIAAQNCKAPQDVLQTTPQSKPQNALQAQTIGSGNPLLDPLADFTFTDAESDAAVARFGCDCPRHIMALRAMGLQGSCVPDTSSAFRSTAVTLTYTRMKGSFKAATPIN